MSRTHIRDMRHNDGILNQIRATPHAFSNSTFLYNLNPTMVIRSNCGKYRLSLLNHKIGEYRAVLDWLTCVWSDDNIVFCDSNTLLHHHVTPFIRILDHCPRKDFVNYFNGLLPPPPPPPQLAPTPVSTAESSQVCNRVKLIENDDDPTTTYQYTIACHNELLLMIAGSPNSLK